MSSFEYCVLAGIFLHLVILVFVLLSFKGRINQITFLLYDIKERIGYVNNDTTKIREYVFEARQEALKD